MSTTGVSKIVAQRNQRILLELVLKPGNDICADCKARAPRWASYNLGIFICVNCASIHRKIGTHVTKVKSITLDEWSKEQVEVMKENGNIKSNALYNPNEARHPPPTNMVDSERDSELEKFIRAKYEFRRFIDRKAGIISQQITADPQISRKTSPGPVPPPKTPENLPPRLKLHPSATITALSHNYPLPARSASQPLPPLTASDKLDAASPLRQPAAMQPSLEKPAGQVWEDLISLQGPSQSSSFPLQYGPMVSVTSSPSQAQILVQPQLTTPGNTPNPFSNLPVSQNNAITPLVASPISISTPGSLFPFVPSAPLSSPALHLGTTNPFNQTPLLSATAGNATFSPNSNPFSSSSMPMSMPSMSMSAPTTPSVQPVMTFLAGTPVHTPLHTPPHPYVPTSAPASSFSPTSFIQSQTPAMTSLAQNPFRPVEAVNAFPAMHMGQVVFSGPPSQNMFLGQQQQPPLQGFSGWAGQGAPGTL